MTLTELLVVMAIIGILVGLLFPAIGAARRHAIKARAQVEVARLKQAFVTYELDYESWPTGLVGYDDPNQPWNSNGLENLTGIQVEPGVVRMLAGLNENGMNPDQNTYLSLRPKQIREDGSFADPWGNPYKYMCDFNYDETVHIEFTDHDWSTNLVGQTVAVWSRGPDQSDKLAGHADDVKSW